MLFRNRTHLLTFMVITFFLSHQYQHEWMCKCVYGMLSDLNRLVFLFLLLLVLLYFFLLLPIYYTATKLAVMVIVISFPTQIKDGLNKCLRHDRASTYARTHRCLCPMEQQVNRIKLNRREISHALHTHIVCISYHRCYHHR